jgi:lipooligosaccharide transport system ATP-binding protein
MTEFTSKSRSDDGAARIGPAPVEARGLTKRYGAFTAVDGIDFSVAEGECVGLLGPNGAGKTTSVRMITCFSPITAGTVRVFGLDAAHKPRQVKRLLGICPQEDNLDPDFSVIKNLLVYARYFDLPPGQTRRRSEELLEVMQLQEKSKANIRDLSGGMKRRLMLARALLNRPRLLVLDEPTTGLDPQARHLIWQRVRHLKTDEGVTVLLTTHYMEEAEQLCDRVILMDGGKILLQGSPQNLVLQEIGREVVELWSLDDGIREFVRQAGWTSEEVEGRLYIFDREGGHVAGEVERQFPGRPRLIRHATLEDVFLHRAGRALKE